MSLQDYRRKRDFARTTEPPDSESATGKRPVFVVQLHHARRRHFDFRLQVGDVLKSWAVPKGPSFDPSVKRLAVEVEDHPLSYADFVGDIPAGNYGAGHVDCFDRGTWSTEGDPRVQLRKGHLEFTLHGDRLRGRWHLIRGHRKERQPSWFLIKAHDQYAGDVEADDLLEKPTLAAPKRSAATPPVGSAAKGKTKPGRQAARRIPLAGLKQRRKEVIDTGFFAPALTQLRDQLPAGDDWLHEIKWDGYRLLTAIAGGQIQCWSRNALAWTERVPAIVEAIVSMGLGSARLDGELVVLDGGHSDFAALQKTLSGERRGRLTYMLFDLTHLNGYDLSDVPLHERKGLLRQLLDSLKGKRDPLLAFSEHVVGHGDEMLAMVMESGLEGVVSKRMDSAYRAGRTGDWLKIKRLESDEFAIVGYTNGKGSRQGFGSLLLGRPSPSGGWDYAGRVGSGFTAAQLKQVGAAMSGRAGGDRCTVHAGTVDPLLRDARWVKPQAVVEVYYRGLGGRGLLRQPSLKALREDKTAADLRNPDRPVRGGKATAKTLPSESIIRGMVISHPWREVYPGITKLDVARYYDIVMDEFLPGVKGRPLSILRCPGGIQETCFFQKHPMAGLKHIERVSLTESSGARRHYLCPTDAESIIELVQFGVIEFHPWGGLASSPERADRIVFDLDPGDGVPWDRVIAAARLVRRLLDKLFLVSFVRTTGGKGLHVVVPLRPAVPWIEVETFSRAFATSLAQSYPDQFIAVSSKARRGGLIFFDYLRNSRGATSVASYSLRARPGAPTAVPLRWDELGKLTSAGAFDIRTLPIRLRRLRRDPWDGIDSLRQSLKDAMRAISA